MSQNSKIRKKKREQKQVRKAKHIVNGIFIGLIALMLLLLIIYSIVAS